MLKFLLFKISQFLVNSLPIKLSYRLALFLSDCQYFLSFKDRAAVKYNLQIILDDKTNIDYLTREVFRNFGRYLVEFFRMEQMTSESFILNNIEVINMHFIDEALANKKGVILLTAHIGSWEYGAVVMSKLGHKITAVALPHKEKLVNEFFNKKREHLGITVVPPCIAYKECVKALKNNNLIAIVGDRDFSDNGQEMDFLGDTALVPKGAALMSIRTGACIIPIFLTRNNGKKFKLEVFSPIIPEYDKIKNLSDDKIETYVKRYLSVIEQQIRKYPDQWLMFRKFAIDNSQKNKQE